jgi:DNA-binding response OmpR family regulator
MRILIVEDEALLAMMVEEWLQDAGHETLGPVRNMRAALEVAQRNPPDLALMDVNLGEEENGVDIARVLKKKYGVPSLYLTAYRDVVEAADTGIGTLAKPVRQEQLLERIGAVGIERNRASPRREP